MSITTMSTKGQIVVSKEVRRKMNLKPGQKFRVELTSSGNILVIPLPRDPIAAMRLGGEERLADDVKELRLEDEKRVEEISKRLA